MHHCLCRLCHCQSLLNAGERQQQCYDRMCGTCTSQHQSTRVTLHCKAVALGVVQVQSKLSDAV